MAPAKIRCRPDVTPVPARESRGRARSCRQPSDDQAGLRPASIRRLVAHSGRADQPQALLLRRRWRRPGAGLHGLGARQRGARQGLGRWQPSVDVRGQPQRRPCGGQRVLGQFHQSARASWSTRRAACSRARPRSISSATTRTARRGSCTCRSTNSSPAISSAAPNVAPQRPPPSTLHAITRHNANAACRFTRCVRVCACASCACALARIVAGVMAITKSRLLQPVHLRG